MTIFSQTVHLYKPKSDKGIWLGDPDLSLARAAKSAVGLADFRAGVGTAALSVGARGSCREGEDSLRSYAGSGNSPLADNLSHASNTRRRVRYSPNSWISFFFSTRKVSPGKSLAAVRSAYPSGSRGSVTSSYGSRIFFSSPAVRSAGSRIYRNCFRLSP